MVLTFVLAVCLVFGVSISVSAQIAPGKDTPPDQQRATPGLRLNQSSTSNSTAVSSAQTTNSATTSVQQSVDPAVAIAGSQTVRSGGAEVFAVTSIVILAGSLYYYNKKLKPSKSSLKTKEVKIKTK